MRITLLVVDDEPVIHELVHEVMDGCAILDALTAAEARAIVERGESYDVAIVDKNLPDGNGLQVVRWLREHRPDAEALVITGYPSMDSAVEAIAAGATDYLIKPMRDIAEMRLRIGNAADRVHRRRNEASLVAELRDSEERYRGLFEANPDAMLVLSAETRAILDVNPAAERLYGTPRAQLLGQPAARLTARDPEPVLRDGLILRRELRADGRAIPVEVSATTARRASHEIIVEVVRDVSERERAAAERAALEQQLARAGRLEALGKLAAGVAHDFNNLLCVIGVSSELARDLTESSEVRDELAQVTAAVQSATALTRQLLGFSGRQITRAQVVDLNARVEAVAQLLQRTIGSRVKLVLDTSPMPLTVLIDPGQLEQVLTNLVVNARDAMPQGGTITVSTRRRAGAQGAPGAVIVVRDTGTGIPAEIVEQIFEPFFTTKSPERGTGLGLATVREIVTRAGGTVTVTSKVGEGTAFEIWIPESDGEIHETTALQTLLPAGRGEIVLVVEDDPQLRRITRRVLASGGYAVHEAAHGEAAVGHVAAGHRVDLVLADIELPGLSGIECAKKICERSPQVKVMFTSGMSADPRGTHPGVRCSAFLPKPYSPDELMRTVRKALDRS